MSIHVRLRFTDTTFVNYEEKIKEIEGILKNWSLRNLTIAGKITVIKSLALPILVQVLTVLPNPPHHIIHKIECLCFSFIWNDKRDKIKRSTLKNNYENGGLKMTDIECFINSLKLTWVKKLLDPRNTSSWKLLLLDDIERYGNFNILVYNKYDMTKIVRNLNSFWRDVFLAWSNPNREENTAEYYLSQPVWFNSNIKIGNEVVYYQL